MLIKDDDAEALIVAVETEDSISDSSSLTIVSVSSFKSNIDKELKEDGKGSPSERSRPSIVD
jgi:hypothetical protein